MSNQIIQSISIEPIFKALIKEKVDPEMARKATEAIRNLAGQNVHIEMSVRFDVQDAIIKNFQTDMETRFCPGCGHKEPKQCDGVSVQIPQFAIQTPDLDHRD